MKFPQVPGMIVTVHAHSLHFGEDLEGFRYLLGFGCWWETLWELLKSFVDSVSDFLSEELGFDSDGSNPLVKTE